MTPADVGANALQATRGFLLGGVLVIAVLDELEAELAFLVRQHRHPDLRLLGLVRDDVDELWNGFLFGDLLGDARHVVTREIAVDRFGRELSLGDALDDGPRAHLRVAAGEHAGAVGHERAVRDDRLALGLLDALLALEEVEVRHLADRGDRRVALDHEVRPFDRNGSPPAGGVGLAEGHALELDAADAAVLLDDANRRREELEADAFVLRVVDLAVVRAHLFSRPPVNDGHVRAEPPRRPGAVERGESAAHDHDLLPSADRHGVALRVHAEVVDRLDDARQVLARDAQLVRAPRAEAEEDRVVTLREEIVDREVAAEHHAALELRIAELPHRVQLLVELHFRQAVLGDAVARDPALLVHHVEDRDGVALERGVIRGGHPGGTRAHDGYAFAG